MGTAPTSEMNAPTIRMGLGEMDWQPIAGRPARQSLDNHKQRTSVEKIDKGEYENPFQPSPISPVLPSLRKVDAYPIRPLGNLAIDLGSRPQRKFDGLPDTTGATIPNFPENEDQVKKPSRLFPQPLHSSPSMSSRPSLGDDELERGRDDGFLADDEQKPLVNGQDEEQRRPRPSPERNDSSMSALIQPFPAQKVFARNGYPLHLPHLDDFLANNRLFAEPHFSDAEALCSEEEKVLYGYNLASSSSRRALEVCGAQLKVPVEVILPKNQHTAKRHKIERRGSFGEDDEHELAVLTKESGPKSPPVVRKESQPDSPTKRPGYERGYSGVTSSTMSTASHPKSRLDKFPPLMLLEQSSIDELKSNAIGPRKPPGGFLGFIPGIGSILGTIVDFVIGVEGSTLAAGIFRLQLFIDFVQLTNLNLYLVKPNASQGNVVNKVLLSTLPSLLALDLVSVFGYAFILMGWIVIVAIILLFFWRMTKKYNPNRLVEGYNSQPWLFRPFRREKIHGHQFNQPATTPSWRSTPRTKFQNVLIVMSLSVLYIPLGKLAIDALVWNVDYWPLAWLVALACGAHSILCRNSSELKSKMQEFIDYDNTKPVLMEVMISDREHVLPMVAAGKGLHEMVIHPELISKNPLPTRSS